MLCNVMAPGSIYALPDFAIVESNSGSVETENKNYKTAESSIQTVAKPTFKFQSASQVLMEATTGEIIYANNENDRLLPASVTKIMTILLVMEAIDSGALALTDTLQASEYAASMGGSQVYIEPGEIMTVEDLLKSVVVASANDAAVVLAENISGRPNAPIRGGQWEVGFHVARMSYTQGKKTAATPNGRPFGQELSKNASPSMGANRGGATAAILSVTKLDATAFVGDASLDLGLLPASVRGEEGLEAMWGLLMTFLRRGGHAIHINVFDADTLRDAQAHPENYRDLQIRVCGWNVLWNNISPEEQAGFIRQAESLI